MIRVGAWSAGARVMLGTYRPFEWHAPRKAQAEPDAGGSFREDILSSRWGGFPLKDLKSRNIDWKEAQERNGYSRCFPR